MRDLYRTTRLVSFVLVATLLLSVPAPSVAARAPHARLVVVEATVLSDASATTSTDSVYSAAEFATEQANRNNAHKIKNQSVGDDSEDAPNKQQQQQQRGRRRLQLPEGWDLKVVAELRCGVCLDMASEELVNGGGGMLRTAVELAATDIDLCLRFGSCGIVDPGPIRQALLTISSSSSNLTPTAASMGADALQLRACKTLRHCEEDVEDTPTPTPPFIHSSIFAAGEQKELSSLMSSSSSLLSSSSFSSSSLMSSSSSSSFSSSVAAPFDLRVTRGHGPKGYDKLRVSVISGGFSGNLKIDDFPFTYDAPFAHRWTNFHLQSALVDLSPSDAGGVNGIKAGVEAGVTAGVEAGVEAAVVDGVKTLTLNGVAVNITLPPRGAGVRGVIVADPCSNSKWISCDEGKRYQTATRQAELLNAAAGAYDGGATAAHRGMDFWEVLGDLWYDRTGEIIQPMFDQLSLRVKATPVNHVLGNHDYWVLGTPAVAHVKKDSFGNGAMQFFAQDSAAAAKDDVNLFDLSVDPSHPPPPAEWPKGLPPPPHPSGSPRRLPAVANSVYWHVIGNAGFFGYSGAYTWKEVEPFAAEACAWFGSQVPHPAVVYVQGHWHAPSMGCEEDMTVPAVWEKMTAMPGCAAAGGNTSSTGNTSSATGSTSASTSTSTSTTNPADPANATSAAAEDGGGADAGSRATGAGAGLRLKFLMGHKHCNQVTVPGAGFLVGGQGMSDGSKCGQWGVSVLDTTGGRSRVLYYALDAPGLDVESRYAEVLTCWRSMGLAGCEHLAEVWLDEPIE